jgi:hypothetical protein
MKPKRPKRSPSILLPASRIEKQKQISPPGRIRKTAYATPAPPKLKMKTQKRRVKASRQAI